MTDPLVSVVVISRDNERIIARAVDAVLRQDTTFEFEVILATSGTDGTARIVTERFPRVRVCEIDHPALPGEARNVGLRVARGEYVAFVGAYTELLPGYLEVLAGRLGEGYSMVTGSMRNGTRTPAGWASYFLDNYGALPARPSRELDQAPGRAAYARRALVELGGFPEDRRTGEDTVVNNELFARGYRAFRDAGMHSIHHTQCSTARVLARHHFQRGRGMGRILAEQAERDGRVPDPRMRRFVTRNVERRLRVVRNVREWGDGLRPTFWRVLPWVVLGATSFWLGGCVELALRVPGARRRVRTGAPAQR